MTLSDILELTIVFIAIATLFFQIGKKNNRRG